MLHVQFLLLDQLLSIEDPVVQKIAIDSGVEVVELVAMVAAAVKGARDRANDFDGTLAVTVDIRLTAIPVGTFLSVVAVLPFEFKVETDLDEQKYEIGGQDLFSVTICIPANPPVAPSELLAASADLN